MMTPTERKAALQRMQQVSNHFYVEAIQIGNHPFIEFCGFMNEYIKLAGQADQQGIDFSDATEHQGRPLPIQPYNAQYIAEKFSCIFGPTFRENPEMWNLFSSVVMKDSADR